MVLKIRLQSPRIPHHTNSFCSPKREQKLEDYKSNLQGIAQSMKKIITIILIIIFSAIAAKSTYAEESVSASSAVLARSESFNAKNDMRAKALENVFKKYNSPLVGEAKTYVELADKYGIDWKLLPAISGLESSFGLHLMLNSYNAYGWGGGYIYFESWSDGIDKILSSLKKNYYNRGADTVYEIASIYAESPTWAPRVTSFMNLIESELERISNEQLPITI